MSGVVPRGIGRSRAGWVDTIPVVSGINGRWITCPCHIPKPPAPLRPPQPYIPYPLSPTRIAGSWVSIRG